MQLRQAAKSASGLYSKLFGDGGVADIGDQRAAFALQEAVIAVRAQDLDIPLSWTQFVHFGA